MVLTWANEYLDFAKECFSYRTYNEKCLAFSTLIKTLKCKDWPVESLTTAHVLKILRVRERATSGYAANKTRKNLPAAWEWGVKYLGFPEKNPVKRAERMAEVREPRRVPSMDELYRVLEIAPNLDRVMLLVALYTAARKGELLRLRWDDVDFEKGQVRLWTRKRQNGTMESDWIPMVEKLRAVLWEHCRHARSVLVFCREDGKAFTSRQHAMPRLCKRAGVERFGFHGVRLTASALDAAGVELTAIQAILRHKSATTTARYLHSLRGPKVALDAAFAKVVPFDAPRLAEEAAVLSDNYRDYCESDHRANRSGKPRRGKELLVLRILRINS